MILLQQITQSIMTRHSEHFLVSGLFVSCLMVLTLSGCGTTKWSDTTRTATEQLLLTNAMDRAVGQMNFCALFNKSTFIDSTAIDGADKLYFISTVRQHLLASGAKIKEKKEDADYIVELRAGTVGTDRNDLMIGVPSFSVPTGFASELLTGTTAVPEIAIFKRTDQRAVVKVAAFVYNRKTNTPVWQSGNIQTESKIRARWIFGTGPITRGDITKGTELAGTKINPTISQIIDLENDKGLAPSVTLPVFYKEYDEKEVENKIPKPTLDSLPLPVSETVPEIPDKPQEMLAANNPGETPPSLPQPNAAPNTVPNNYVPDSTLLPWQTPVQQPQFATPRLAPGFDSYLR